MKRRKYLTLLMAILLLAPKYGCAKVEEPEILPERPGIEDGLISEDNEELETLFVSRDYSPVRTSPYNEGRENEVRRLSIGNEVTIIDNHINTLGNLWHRLPDEYINGGYEERWFYSGNTTPDLSTIYNCANDDHSFNARGFCVGCEKEYELEINAMESTPFSITNANNRATTPARLRPYSGEDEYRDPIRIPEGAQIVVDASARNQRGHLWYRFQWTSEEGTLENYWIYSGNVTQLTNNLGEQTSSNSLKMVSVVTIQGDSSLLERTIVGATYFLEGNVHTVSMRNSDYQEEIRALEEIGATLLGYKTNIVGQEYLEEFEVFYAVGDIAPPKAPERGQILVKSMMSRIRPSNRA